MPNYKISDWDRDFENNRTRDLKRMEWVPIPNRMDGEGYTELVAHPNGAAHFGAWIAIVEIASRRKVRGTLPEDAAQCLGRMSRLPAALFSEVIPRLLKIGWLTEIPTDNAREFIEMHKGAGKPQEGAGDCLRARVTEGNGMEGNGTHTQRAPEIPKAIDAPKPHAEDLEGVVSQRFDEFWQRWPLKQKRDMAARAWLSVVMASEEEEVFSCLDRFLGSDWNARGVVPMAHNWIMEQQRDGWQGDWPARANQNGHKSKQQEMADSWRDA